MRFNLEPFDLKTFLDSAEPATQTVDKGSKVQIGVSVDYSPTNKGFLLADHYLELVALERELRYRQKIKERRALQTGFPVKPENL